MDSELPELTPPEPKNGNSKVQGQLRNFCATAWVSHYKREELEKLLQERASYYVFSIEKAPSTGSLHYQMYVELKNRTSTSVCYKWLPKVRMAARRGSQKEAIDYCMKSDTHVEGPFEFGERSTQGVEGGLRSATLMLSGGARLRDVALEHPDAFVRYARGLGELSFMMRAYEERIRPTVWYIYGPPGSGKSYHARRTVFGGNYDTVNYVDGRFVGYYGCENVILDDFDGRMPRQLLMQLLDEGRMTIRTVGGTAIWNPKHIIITSNFEPSYYEHWEPLTAFYRRLDVIYNKINIESELIDVTHLYR